MLWHFVNFSSIKGELKKYIYTVWEQTKSLKTETLNVPRASLIMPLFFFIIFCLATKETKRHLSLPTQNKGLHITKNNNNKKKKLKQYFSFMVADEDQTNA